MVSSEKDKLLLRALQDNDLEECKDLIKSGVDVNKKDKLKNTILTIASWNGYKEICSLLLENGANVNIKNNYGETALTIASYLKHKEVCLILIENGANIEEKDADGDTALIWACRSECKEMVSLLISSGCYYSSRYKRISYNRLSLPTFRTFMIEYIKNQKDIKLKKLINIVPEEILDDINNKSIGYCTKCQKHFYYYKYELKLEDLRKNEIIDVKVHCL